MFSQFHSKGSWQYHALHADLNGAELCPGKPQMRFLQVQMLQAPVGLAGLLSSLRSELSEPQM